MSVKVLIEDQKGRYLFLRRAISSGANPGKWELPGGKVDPGEEFGQAIRREVHEETGLRVETGAVLGHMESVFDDRMIVYLVMGASVRGGEPSATPTITLSEEHDEFSWVGPDSILSLDLAPQYRRFFERHTA